MCARSGWWLAVPVGFEKECRRMGSGYRREMYADAIRRKNGVVSLLLLGVRDEIVSAINRARSITVSKLRVEAVELKDWRMSA